MHVTGLGRILALAICLVLAGAGWCVTPAGIVYESEAISEPASAWLQDERTGDHWLLWTKEENIEAKRSGGAVLASPVVKADRETAGGGAPPLHGVVDDLAPGTYLVYASSPGARPLAYSLDGEDWLRHAGGELFLGAKHLPEGRFELWVDDRYAHPPENPGPGYYDYLRFVPVPDSAVNVKHTSFSSSLRKRLAEDQRAFAVAATETSDWKGFEIDGEWLRAGEKGDQFTYTFDRSGTYYMAVSMVDDDDGVEQLSVRLNGEEVGCIVAAQSGRDNLFSFLNPMMVSAGDTLTFTCETTLGYYRVGQLYFASEFITPPPPQVQYVETWVAGARRGGDLLDDRQHRGQRRRGLWRVRFV